jgi:predicted phosphodiesterase
MIVSDRTGGHRMGVFSDAVMKANLLQPEFIMSVGDLVEGYTEDSSTIESQWDEFDGIIQKAAARFFYVPGNHDYTNKTMGDIWRARLGPDYYHFLYKDVLFICMNSEDHYNQGYNTASLGKEQYLYFKSVLEKHQNVRWTFVFMHQPLWIYKDTGSWTDFELLLQQRNHTVFAGHVHKYTHYNRNKSDYIVLGTTGGISNLRGKAFGEADHLSWVTMRESGPIIANIMLDGIEDKAFVTEESKLIFDKISKTNPVYIETRIKDNSCKTDTLKFVVKNEFDIPLQIRARAFANKSIVPFLHDIDVSVDKNTIKELTIPIRYLETEMNGLPEPLCFDVSGNIDHNNRNYSWRNKIYFAPMQKNQIEGTKEPIYFDGKIDDWDSLPYSFEHINDTSLLTKFNIIELDSGLFIGISVTDPFILGKVGRGATESEGITIAIDANPMHISAHNNGDIPSYFKGIWQSINFTPVSPAGEFAESFGNTNGICGKYALNDIGYSAEVYIPTDLLVQKQDADWETIRINLMVNDFDENGEMWTSSWQPLWWNEESIAGSGTFFR